MTETPTESARPADQQPGPTSGTGPGGPGMDRQHLRNYEALRRSSTNRKVAGVAGGLGRHLNIDPTILRVLFVVLCLFGGAGLVLYAAVWLFVPEDDRATAPIETSPGTRNALLIGAGVLAVLVLLGNGWNQVFFPWPLMLVGVGVLVYLLARDQSGPRSAPAGTPGAPGVPGPQYGAPQSGVEHDLAAGGGQSGPPPWAPATPPPPYSAPRRTKRGPKLFGFTLALVALALGSLGLYDYLGGDVTDAAYPALALTMVGLMLVVGAFVGRAGGLILLGIVASIALAGAAVDDAVGGFGPEQRRTYEPTSATAVDGSYFVETGQVMLDLSEVSDPAELAGRTVDVGTNAGEVVVVLPDGIETEVAASIDGPGQVDLPDDNSGGIDTELSGTYNEGEGDGVLTINAHTNVGHIDVRTN